MSVEIKREDFAEWDIDIAECAGGELFAALADLMHHNYNAGEGWYPFADQGDTPAVIAEVRGHIERLESAIKKAKADLASIERPARLAAYRRQKREGT
jgi:hypothetical protein